MDELLYAKRLLEDGDYTCVLHKGEDTLTLTDRGVKPLVKLISGGANLSGYSAADKVVGKATAFLYMILKVKSLYAAVISRPALELLSSADIEVSYDTLADNIINRKGDGICPFEEATLDLATPEDAYPAILAKMKQMNISID